MISTALGLDSLRSVCSASAGVPAAVAAGLTTVCSLYTAEHFPFGAVSNTMTGFVPDAGVVGPSDVETVNIKGMLKSEALYPCAKVDGTAPAAGGITRTRRYYYDGMKCLTDAAHYTGTSTTTDNLKTERGVGYDRNGNITGLSRYGAAGLDATLTFTHTGNRLTGVLGLGLGHLRLHYGRSLDLCLDRENGGRTAHLV